MADATQAAPPANDPEQEKLLMNLLKEIQHQCSADGMQTTSNMKTMVRKMLERAEIFDESKKKSADEGDGKGEKKEKKKKKKETLGECCVCGQEKSGTYHKTGFRCVMCTGRPSKQPPPGENKHIVPSSGKVPGFAFFERPENAAVKDSVPKDANGHPIELAEAAAVLRRTVVPRGTDPVLLHPNAAKQSALSRQGSLLSADANDTASTASPFSPALVGLDLGGSIGVSRQESILHVGSSQSKPLTKYAVNHVPCDFTDPVQRKRGDQITIMRELYHPSLLYNYAMTRDEKRNRVWVVHESATPLEGRGVIQTLSSSSSATTDGKLSKEASQSGGDRSFEVVKQVATAALQALEFLYNQGFSHNDMRPRSIFVDSHRFVKLLMAPFPPDPLPLPFRAPECDIDDQQKADKKTLHKRDIYALGVTLSILAYGQALQFPSAEASLPAEELVLINFIQTLCHADPDQRPTAEKALENSYLSTVRIVQGAAVETIVSKIMPLISNDEPTHLSPEESTLQVQLDSELLMHVEPDSVNEGALILDTFIRQQGPEFQIVRTSNHVTIYSVKNDPRRKRSRSLAQSMMSSVFEASGMGASMLPSPQKSTASAISAMEVTSERISTTTSAAGSQQSVKFNVPL